MQTFPGQTHEYITGGGGEGGAYVCIAAVFLLSAQAQHRAVRSDLTRNATLK